MASAKSENKTSKYKGVAKMKDIEAQKGKWGWKGMYVAQYRMSNGKIWNKHCKTEIEAAIAYDLKMIELGKEPVNILKPRHH